MFWILVTCRLRFGHLPLQLLGLNKPLVVLLVQSNAEPGACDRQLTQLDGGNYAPNDQA